MSDLHVFNDEGLGVWGESTTFEVTAERISAYAEATNDPIKAHLDGEVASPVFAIVPVFDAAIETIKTGLSVLTPEEQAERTRRIVDACRQVAEASGGLGKVLGLGSGVSGEEETLLDAISTSLRAR